jgi:transcriptional regulator with PAS, ATPase and Fis domain
VWRGGMKNGDSSGRMPDSEIDQRLAKILDSEILEKFGFGSSSLNSKSQESFMEWITTFLIAKSPKMQEIIRLIEQISGADVSVLITGEAGTGKESVARAIHYSSIRREKPLVMINCAALPEGLLDSELFGCVEGTYTGAVKDRVGRLEVADKGTLFLDEVSELPLSIQNKLSYFLRENAFRRAGTKSDVNIDVRIISATSEDLNKAVNQGKFREDLFYRLNVVQINIPPLRERKSDIPMLVNHFIKKYNLGAGKDIQGISPKALKQLMSYDFPGNIRELENIIRKSLWLETSQTIEEVQVSSLPEWLTTHKARMYSFEMTDKQMDLKLDEEMDLKKSIRDMEKVLILKALEMTRGSKKAAANLLRISPRTLKFKLDRYGILKTQ